MAIAPGRRGVLLIGLIVALLALTVTAYAFRSRLVSAPLVGSFFGAGQASEAGGGQGEILYWTCPMHPDVHEGGPGACPECGMDLVPVTRAEADEQAATPHAEHEVPPAEAQGEAPDRLGRMPLTIDLRRQQLIGVRTAPVERSALTRAIRTVGTVEYDETRLSDVNLKLEGWIRDLHVDYTGRLVRKGEPLFTLYSPELVTTQNEYLLALKTRDRLSESPIGDAREYADRLVEAARQRLTLWDLPSEQIAAIAETREPQTALLFRSPVDGFVIEKRVFSGMHVRPGDSLYRIADLSRVWVEGDFYESDVAVLREGQHAAVTLDAYPGERFAGQVIYIYPYVEERTRTIRVRFEFPNREGRLKPGMYANVELDVSLDDGLTVPTNALLASGTRQYVFVSLGDGHFEPRRVRIGQRLSEAVQILEGLEEGEQVATNAAFFIDSESQLRAALEGFAAPPAPAEPAAPGERLQIAYSSRPDPPRTGDNSFEVTVRDPDGAPVTDGEVTVTFYMAAMPTMNMPAMRTEAALMHGGGGVYRGTGTVAMAGRWEVTVTVTRSGRRAGSRQFAVVAR
jgi:RND family efflux transporter MFP subunit